MRFCEPGRRVRISDRCLYLTGRHRTGFRLQKFCDDWVPEQTAPRHTDRVVRSISANNDWAAIWLEPSPGDIT